VRDTRLPYSLLALGLALLLWGSWWGLFLAPRETYMGDVQRIMYVHVPTAWNAMLALTFAFGCALVSLFRDDPVWDARLEAALEVGVVLSALLCMQGAIWAKPTWGVWWDWDPRLTTTAVMVFAFGGILALRAFVDDPVKRATWSAVAAIVAYVDVPIVYFSVKWWNSLHQTQSSPETVSRAFHWPLRINAFGMLFLMCGLISLRARLAALRREEELAPPLSAPAVAARHAAGGAR
jgi:heme exporter protein C